MQVPKDICYARRDGVWKDFVRKEKLMTRYQWPANWAFLVDEYKDVSYHLKNHSIKPVFSVASIKNQPIVNPMTSQYSFPKAVNSGAGADADADKASSRPTDPGGGGVKESSLPKLVSFSDKMIDTGAGLESKVWSQDDDAEEDGEKEEGKERTYLPKLVDGDSSNQQKQEMQPPKSRSWINECHIRQTASMVKLAENHGRLQPLSMQEYLHRKHSGIPYTTPPLKQWTYPRTTSEEVGWKARYRGNHLELFGKVSRPKRNFYKTMRWPVGSE